jgi:hypothetical protein
VLQKNIHVKLKASKGKAEESLCNKSRLDLLLAGFFMLNPPSYLSPDQYEVKYNSKMENSYSNVS